MKELTPKQALWQLVAVLEQQPTTIGKLSAIREALHARMSNKAWQQFKSMYNQNHPFQRGGVQLTNELLNEVEDFISDEAR